ncbi:MAG: MaoC family dehydratase [Acetivibrionales bacterium]|jgi:3-hydroxybutyryl-CoA dehydratase
MSKITLNIGDAFTFSKTVGETDVYLFAGITGDFNNNHINEEYMSNTVYKKRIMHGALGVGFMSTASSVALNAQKLVAVSAGYDRIRFIKPVFIGDTVTVKYTIEEKDEEKMKTVANVELFNQNGELCTVGKHIAKYFE